MLLTHFIENIFRFVLTLVSSNDIITIKVDNVNVKKKKLNNKKDYLKKWTVKWTKGKRTQIMRWKKNNLQIFTF